MWTWHGAYSVLNAFFKLLTSSCVNIGSDVLNHSCSEVMSYGLYKNMSSSWITSSYYFPLLEFVNWWNSSVISWYASCIYYMCSLTCVCSFPLHLFNASDNNFWMCCICLSMSPCIKFYNSSEILYISPLICLLCIFPACNNVVSMSANLMFTTVASLTRFCTFNCISAILSSPQIMWWYFFVQFFFSWFRVKIRLIFLTLQAM